MSENIWTVMTFCAGQTQAVVLQYKTAAAANRDHDLLMGDGAGKVRLTDDYGRCLSVRPADVPMVLLQDVDRAAEGNTVSNVKNNIANAMAQVATQSEMERNPEVKAAMTRAALTQGVPRSPLIQ